MYLGRIVESAPTKKIVDDPKHPYTQALTNAIPLPDPDMKRERTGLDEAVGDASELPTGCRFKDRCPDRFEACDKNPADISIEGDEDRQVACHLYDEDIVEGMDDS
jgi:peptide/nickel transport system ATP-binding protein